MTMSEQAVAFQARSSEARCASCTALPAGFALRRCENPECEGHGPLWLCARHRDHLFVAFRICGFGGSLNWFEREGRP